jgi:hypothetical protein
MSYPRTGRVLVFVDTSKQTMKTHLHIFYWKQKNAEYQKPIKLTQKLAFVEKNSLFPIRLNIPVHPKTGKIKKLKYISKILITIFLKFHKKMNPEKNELSLLFWRVDLKKQKLLWMVKKELKKRNNWLFKDKQEKSLQCLITAC